MQELRARPQRVKAGTTRGRAGRGRRWLASVGLPFVVRKCSRRSILTGVSALYARVENGRLKLDEPTDLPEGTVVPLEIAGDCDDFDDAERAALHESIREGIEDMEAGRTSDARTVVAGLRSRL